MTQPLTAPGKPVWGSTSLRLAALSGFLVLISMLAALALVYVQVSLVLHRNVERQMQQTQHYIISVYESAGAEAAAQVITRNLADGRDTDSELYLLTRPDGTPMAGNLQNTALQLQPTESQWVVKLHRNAESVNAKLLSHTFGDHARLLVGHDLRELDAVESTVATASVMAGIFSLLLALASTLIFRRELARSVGAVHSTIARIRGGSLQARVPVEPAHTDEFAQLEQDFNQMLDHIEQLMNGVRHVSDTIAHNVRTPLTRIRLRLQAAFAEREATADDLRAAMVGAMENIDSVSHMLDKLLHIAQAEAGMRRQAFEPLQWSDVASEVIELYEDLAEEEDVRIDWQCEHDAPVLGDRSVLAGALVNVLDNAIKYAGRGAHIVITTRQREMRTTPPGTSVSAWRSEIIVRDNGTQLQPKDLPALAERFVRLQPDKPGHGLGLASVRAMMQLHGGEMLLASAHPGLEVTLSLPAHG